MAGPPPGPGPLPFNVADPRLDAGRGHEFTATFQRQQQVRRGGLVPSHPCFSAAAASALRLCLAARGQALLHQPLSLEQL